MGFGVTAAAAATPALVLAHACRLPLSGCLCQGFLPLFADCPCQDFRLSLPLFLPMRAGFSFLVFFIILSGLELSDVDCLCQGLGFGF